jgi:dienelactone hydrolase
MKLAVAAYICVLSLVSLPFCGGGVDRPDPQDLSPDEVTYQAEDGVRIVAGWWVPPNRPTPPVVILLHELGGTRAQWDAEDVRLPGIFLENGYAVLAPDLRGHGKSNVVLRDGREEPYTYTNSLDAIRDVKAAIEWLKGRDDVDLTRIAVMGSRLGGNLAYASTAMFKDVKTAVVISPDPYWPDNFDPIYKTIPDYCAHDVFYAAGSRPAWEAAASIGFRTSDIGGDRYEDRSDLDGVALLTIDQPIKDILKWFEEELIPTPRPTPVGLSGNICPRI